jgi:hypothetical protein
LQSSLKMPHLSRFPVEVLSIVTSHIDAFDICHLIWTGDRKLCKLLNGRGVEEFRMIVDEKMPKSGINHWPRLVQHLSGLRSLTISINFKYCNADVPLSHVRPDLLPPSLEEVHFRFLQAETCFLRYPPPFDLAFPHQFGDNQSIELGTYSDSEEWFSSDSEEPQFPDESGVLQGISILKASVLKQLKQLPAPPTMRLYDHQYYGEGSWNKADVFNFAKYLPNLRILSLRGFAAFNPSTLKHLPSSLESLRLSSTVNFKGMKKAYVKQITFDQFDGDWDATARPKLLRHLSNITTTCILPEIMVSKSVTRLTLNQPDWEWNLAALPPNLTHLSISRPTKSSHVTSKDIPWPSKLSSISLDRCRWPEHWPASLTALHAVGFHELNRVEAVSKLPRTLQSLELFMLDASLPWVSGHFKALPPNLKTFDVGFILVADIFSSLPKSITSMKNLQLTSYEDCKLLPPNLKEFTISDSKVGTFTLKYLPKSIESLTIRCRGSQVNGKIAKDLPRGLRNLHVHCSEVSSDFFEDLPPDLSTLIIWGEIRGASSPLIISKLPKHILRINLPTEVYTPDETILLLPRGVLIHDIRFSFSVSGDRTKFLPPSLRLMKSDTRANPDYDIPDKETEI